MNCKKNVKFTTTTTPNTTFPTNTTDTTNTYTKSNTNYCSCYYFCFLLLVCAYSYPILLLFLLLRFLKETGVRFLKGTGVVARVPSTGRTCARARTLRTAHDAQESPVMAGERIWLSLIIVSQLVLLL